MPTPRIAAAAAAIAVATPLAMVSTAQAASFFPTAIEATCLSSCLDQNKTYTQTFSASAFSGPVSIGALSFNRALLGGDDHSVFHVTFWTADGKEVGDFGHWMVGSLAGDKLTLKGDSFVFDPSLGPLTMKLQLDDYSHGAGGAGGGGWGFGGGGGGGSGLGNLGGDVVTTHNFMPPGIVDNPGLGFTPPGIINNPGLGQAGQPVPEPAGWAMMILGFGGAGALLRGRRRLFA